ncbi:MAG: glycoside hydrolase family 3 protein [Elusimicrobiales bacterium]|nr:glycoside hydrolase family 3 protein [Elusimicrobiales bacterium]
MRYRRRLLLFLLLLPATARAAGPSIEEKAAQLLIAAADAADISTVTAAVKAGLGGVQLQWGSYSLEDTRRLTAALQEAAPGAPLFIAVDYEGGSVYVPTTLGLLELPTNMMLGAAADENNTATLFYLAGKELRRAGINLAFGPVLDVNTNPKNPIIGIRSLGSDPEQAARLGGAIINGLKAAGVVAVAKHFPGHGAAAQDSHKTLPEIALSTADLAAVHLVPFRAAIRLGVPGIMTAHILYPALDARNPATLSPAVLGGLLKRELGYGGLVFTDSLDMSAITSRRSVRKAAAAALKAGADVLLIGKADPAPVIREIAAQVRAGRISQERLDDAYARVLAAKRAAGLFSPAETSSPFDKAYVQITGDLSRRGLTLVKNDGLLPLPRDKKIAVIIFAPQRFADNAIHLYRVLLENGYQASQYLFDIRLKPGEKEQIRLAAAQADILVLGSFQWAAGQNIGQREIITELAAGKPSVLLSLMNPYDLAGYPQARAALALYGMTAPSMAAAGEALSGLLEPAGQLPVHLSK